MSELKCPAVFLKNNKWFLAQCVKIFWLPLIWWGNANFLHVIKAQITRMWIELHALCSDTC